MLSGHLFNIRLIPNSADILSNFSIFVGRLAKEIFDFIIMFNLSIIASKVLIKLITFASQNKEKDEEIYNFISCFSDPDGAMTFTVNAQDKSKFIDIADSVQVYLKPLAKVGEKLQLKVLKS